MGKFVTHECIANEFFAPGISLANPSQSAWGEILVSSEPSLLLMSERMSEDYRRLNSKMSKPWGSQELDSWITEGKLEGV